MQKSILFAGMLAAVVALTPLVSDAAKPYQRFDENAIYENTTYKVGEKICVEKRTTPDGQTTPWVQFRVLGQDNLNAERFDGCDSDAIMHKAERNLEAQVRWEETHGRQLFTREVSNLNFSYSPGSLLCNEHYKLYKVNRKGDLQGTGRSCGVVDQPTLDPR